MGRVKRAHPRLKRRVSCNIIVRGDRHVGVVLNLSQGGFFVQTGAMADIGANVDVSLRGSDGETIDVAATVTNRRAVPRRMATVARGGLGCKLTGAPEAYYHLLADINPA